VLWSCKVLRPQFLLPRQSLSDMQAAESARRMGSCCQNDIWLGGMETYGGKIGFSKTHIADNSSFCPSRQAKRALRRRSYASQFPYLYDYKTAILLPNGSLLANYSRFSRNLLQRKKRHQSPIMVRDRQELRRHYRTSISHSCGT
jgi:hypothetical protein